MISLHDHPVRLPDPLTRESWTKHRTAGRDHLGYDGLAVSGLTAVFASALSGLELPALLRWLALLGADLAHASLARLATRGADVLAGGPISVVLALEDLTPVGGDLTGIEVLYGVGVRSAASPTTRPTRWAAASRSPTTPG